MLLDARLQGCYCGLQSLTLSLRKDKHSTQLDHIEDFQKRPSAMLLRVSSCDILVDSAGPFSVHDGLMLM